MNPTSILLPPPPDDFDPSRYSVSIQKILVDKEYLYVGTVSELPDVATYGETCNEAYEAVLGVILTLRQAAIDEHRSFPDPQPPKIDFSGRVTLRMPRHLHARLDSQAQNEGVSLNTWITSLLSNATAYFDIGWQVGSIRKEVFVSNIRLFGAVAVSQTTNYLSKIDLTEPGSSNAGAHMGLKWQLPGQLTRQLPSIPATM